MKMWPIFGLISLTLASNTYHFGNYQPLMPWYYLPYQKPIPFSKAEVQSYPMGISLYGARQAYLDSLEKIVYNEGNPCNQEGVLVPNPGDCGSFLICVHEKFIAQSCQSGLHFDNKIKACNFPEAANCGGSTTDETGDEAVISIDDKPEPSTQKPADNDDQDNNGQWKPDPNPGQWEWKPPTTTTTETSFIETSNVAQPLSGDYKVVCYFTNWAWYRPGVGKYRPEDIDPTICTHVVYGFAVLDSNNLIIKPHDSWADLDNQFYKKVTSLKKYGIKVTVAIGGWNDSLGGKYSKLVNNPAARAKFVSHVVEFVEKHGFDGLDLDWEYPKCWQVDCSKGPASDKEAFALWVSELKAAFEPKGLLLSAAVSPSKKVMDAGYDIPSIARDLDWIAVMTYDYHGHWDKKTGHVAPMYAHPEDDYDYFNTDFTMKYWMENGAPANKLVMGMPLYGQAFTLNDQSKAGLNAQANQKGQAGQFTRAAGFLAYYEICHNLKQGGWNVVKDEEGRMGPYAHKGRQWVGYDDVAMIKYKSEYIRKMGFAGGMVWALDLDDFKNRCGEGHHPLMNTIKAVLGPKMSADEQAARTRTRTFVMEVPDDVEESNIEEESNVEEEVSNSIHQRFKPEDLFYNVPQPIPQPWYQPYLYYLIPTYSPEIGSNEEPAAYDY